MHYNDRPRLPPVFKVIGREASVGVGVCSKEKLQFPASLFYVRAMRDIKKGPSQRRNVAAAAAVKSTKKETSDENIFTPLSGEIMSGKMRRSLVFFSLYSSTGERKRRDESHWEFALFLITRHQSGWQQSSL